MRIVDPNTKIVLDDIPIFLTVLSFTSIAGILLKKGDVVCEWDPFNAVIVSEATGKVQFDNVIEGVTYKVESDEQTGLA